MHHGEYLVAGSPVVLQGLSDLVFHVCLKVLTVKLSLVTVELLSRKNRTFVFQTVVVPYYYLFLLSVFILWFIYYVGDIFCKF